VKPASQYRHRLMFRQRGRAYSWEINIYRTAISTLNLSNRRRCAIGRHWKLSSALLEAQRRGVPRYLPLGHPIRCGDRYPAVRYSASPSTSTGCFSLGCSLLPCCLLLLLAALGPGPAQPSPAQPSPALAATTNTTRSYSPSRAPSIIRLRQSPLQPRPRLPFFFAPPPLPFFESIATRNSAPGMFAVSLLPALF
jgi:hypothetical protein